MINRTADRRDAVSRAKPNDIGNLTSEVVGRLTRDAEEKRDTIKDSGSTRSLLQSSYIYCNWNWTFWQDASFRLVSEYLFRLLKFNLIFDALGFLEFFSVLIHIQRKHFYLFLSNSL